MEKSPKPRDPSIHHIAMEIMAQLTRFVVRKQMTKEEAAIKAYELADALMDEKFR